MLVEFKNVRQEPGTGRRRWFDGGHGGLVVWYRPDGGIDGFQILYRLGEVEHALTWREAGGFTHNRVDSGTTSPLKNQTPILLPNGAVPWPRMLREFDADSAALEPELRMFVRERLEAGA